MTTENEKFIIEVLKYDIIDSISNVNFKKHLKAWEFDNKYQLHRILFSRNQARICINTPFGYKFFKLHVSEIKK